MAKLPLPIPPDLFVKSCSGWVAAWIISSGAASQSLCSSEDHLVVWMDFDQTSRCIWNQKGFAKGRRRTYETGIGHGSM
ncbi:unnamed protein product [Arabidopsis thaliana]|uniref:Uncharacterized protein n=1 Tax=Arabidopsis thaliana TaxID=3702 RepID=A0A654ELE2_ARATH|nr:unnamed protein product [Arabidopsis thaliana]